MDWSLSIIQKRMVPNIEEGFEVFGLELENANNACKWKLQMASKWKLQMSQLGWSSVAMAWLELAGAISHAGLSQAVGTWLDLAWSQLCLAGTGWAIAQLWLEISQSSLQLCRTSSLSPLNFKTAPHPLFPLTFLLIIYILSSRALKKYSHLYNYHWKLTSLPLLTLCLTCFLVCVIVYVPWLLISLNLFPT